MRALYLLGFRGSGKTTLGRLLAAEIGADFVDLDDLWEARTGETILRHVAEHGIASFRRGEAALLAEVEAELQRAGRVTIVATGGGILEDPANEELLRRSEALKVYLEVPADELWRRLAEHPERRQIGDLHDSSALSALLARRAPAYEKIATATLPNGSISFSLNELKQVLNRSWPPGPGIPKP